jgi:hypothetical protein
VGAEDSEELVQDAIVTAAQMLSRLDVAGKTVSPGNVAYYTILHMKSGRRSQCRSRADVMACCTQLDHRSSLLSTEEEVVWDPELDEPVHVPFGFNHQNWLDLKAQIQPGDGIPLFTSPPETWRGLCGTEGYVLVRGDEVISGFITRMS